MARESLIAECRNETRLRLAQGYPRLESDVEGESTRIAEMAAAGFRRKVNTFPELLREKVEEWDIWFYSQNIREKLILEIPMLVELHQIQQKKEPSQSDEFKRQSLVEMLGIVE
jgi:hypothetical protein